MSDVISIIPASEFVAGDDGYYVYWPESATGGAYSAHMLREIANHLDTLNADWDAQVQKHFAEDKGHDA